MSDTRACHCDDCEWEGTVEDLVFPDNIHQRVEGGERMPDGACPECDSLIHVDPEWTARDMIACVADGWVLVLHGAEPDRYIRAVTEDDDGATRKFSSDDEALAHVVREASCWKDLHRRALYIAYGLG